VVLVRERLQVVVVVAVGAEGPEAVAVVHVVG
jgi:hypothetical protein